MLALLLLSVAVDDPGLDLGLSLTAVAEEVVTRLRVARSMRDCERFLSLRSRLLARFAAIERIRGLPSPTDDEDDELLRPCCLEAVAAAAAALVCAAAALVATAAARSRLRAAMPAPPLIGIWLLGMPLVA